MHATSSMTKNLRRRQRRRRRHKPTKPTTSWRRPEEPPAGSGGAPTTSTVYDVPDHILELIFHGLDSPVCLVRAASACKRWCRVAAEAEFLDGFRSRRVPLIAGHYHHTHNTRPVFVPTSPASSIHGRHDFSLDFVPNIDDSWAIADVRDGLLLLSRKTACRADLVVCEPLTRRYRAIAPLDCHDGWPCLGFYLLKDDSWSSSIGLSTFKVIAVRLRRHLCDHRLGVPAAFVYSSSGTRRRGCWTRVDCPWNTKISLTTEIDYFSFAGRAHGCIYWGVLGSRVGELLALDEATNGVSQFKLPLDIQGSYEATKFRIMEGEHGALRAVRATAKELKIFALLRGGDEWVLEGLLQFEDVTRGLPGRHDHDFRNGALIVAAHETYLVMAPWVHTRWQFTVDLKTLAVEAVRDRIGTNWPEFPYQLPWPPTLKYCS